MNYEGLEEARAKRAAKEKATVEKGRGKRGRKRKSPAPEEASSVSTDNEVLEPGKAPAPWRVSVARVYWKSVVQLALRMIVREICVGHIVYEEKTTL